MKRTTITFLLSIFLQYSVFAACPLIIMSGQQISCFGGSNGQATVTILSGTSGNYTYTWSNGVTNSGPTGSTISFLSAGTYTVNVRDNVTGCTATGAYVVGQPNELVLSGSVVNVDCRGDASGSINLSVAGGSGTYNYNWTNSSGLTVSTVQDLNGVTAGTYTVTVEAPDNTCDASAVFVIGQPAESLQSSAVISNASCFGTLTGAIDVSVWGGTSPYSYSWDNGAFTQDLSSVQAGSYNLTITDARGCFITRNFTINQPAILGGSLSSTPVLCFGDATGSITASAVGGSSPYSYSWSNTSTLFASNTAILANVPADNYQVIITDNQNCQTTLQGVILQPSELLLATSSTDVNCSGGNDGTVSSNVSGGISPYTYQWTNTAGATVGTTDNLTNLIANTYTLIVTDQNNCTVTNQEIVTEPPSPITVSFVKVDVLCNGDAAGSIDLSVVGGTAPYTYLWSNGSINADISNLTAGIYTYLVTDDNGCTTTAAIEITEPAAPLQVLSTIQDVSCDGFTDGSIVLTVSGGTPNYTYEWQNSQFLLSETGNSLIDFPADNYRYEVTDENGCSVVDTLTINQPTPLASTISGVDILCKGENTGSASIVVSGGVTPYSYAWNTGDVVPSINNLPAGPYDVTIVDGNNCILTNSIVLNEPNDTLSFSFLTEDVLCNDGNNGSISLTVEGGTTPYAYTWSNGETSPFLPGLTAGVYEFLVTDNNGCTIGDSIEIFQPDPLVMNEVITDASCFGFSDGTIDIDPTGGTFPYTYTWFNSLFALSSTSQDLVDYPADIYQVVITDTNGCVYESFFELTEPDLLEVSFDFNPISCFDGEDGNVFVDVQGGTQAYNFNWSNGATTQDLLNVPFGSYSLIVTDAQNCIDSIAVFLDEPEPVVMTFITEEVSCIDQFDGTAEVFPSGGNGGYTFNWSTSEINSLVENLNSEWYSVEITDILGCTGLDSVFVDRNLIDCVDPVNAFSPNGDNYNDTWIIDNLQLYPRMQMQIYNKWGNLVHNLEGLYSPWDGTSNERQLPAEVYYYILNLNNEENDVLTGNITILR